MPDCGIHTQKNNNNGEALKNISILKKINESKERKKKLSDKHKATQLALLNTTKTKERIGYARVLAPTELPRRHSKAVLLASSWQAKVFVQWCF